MVERAQRAVDLPAVQEMVRQLANYGLGVYLPHMHTDDQPFLPLPPGVVQVESEDLEVSFLPADHDLAQKAKAVGWVWDSDRGVVTASYRCGRS